MRILAVETKLPGPRYSQDFLVQRLKESWSGSVSDRALGLLDRFSLSSGVKTKHLALDPGDYARLTSFSERNQRFQEVGEQLSIEAVKAVLAKSHLSVDQIDGIFFTTITGISVPSMDARLVDALRFREDIKRTPLFGLGCSGGAAGIARIHDYLKAFPKHAVILLSVELCSLTLQLDDLNPENLVASTLFGDGATAALCVGEEHPFAQKAALETVATRSRFYPNTRHIMGWDVGSHGFKIILDPKVPELVQTYLSQDLKKFLSGFDLEVSDIKTWISHPGGPKVLKAIETSLNLAPEALKHSWRQLETMGNLSSSSVLAILQMTLEEREKDLEKERSWGILMAMGPGFSLEKVLVRWT